MAAIMTFKMTDIMKYNSLTQNNEIIVLAKTISHLYDLTMEYKVIIVSVVWIMIVAAIFKFKMADIVNQLAIARPITTKLQA